MNSDEQARRERAAERAKVMVIRKARLGQPELDFTPVSGAAAISLATRLTIESFSLTHLRNAPDDADARAHDGVIARFVPRTRA